MSPHRKLTGKLNAGSDPEEFALSKDGRQIYISNEDTKTASVIDIASAKLEHIIPVGQEPEGVTTTPDGKQFYVTCEAGGDIYVIDANSYTAAVSFQGEWTAAQRGISRRGRHRIHSLGIGR